MSDTVTFSIITCTFNAQKTLEPTMKSVASQQYARLEHIIIDGASQDGTMDIVSRWSDDRTKVTCESDRGLYDAMNKGIASATGDYLIFLNAGDTFHSRDTLQKVSDLLSDGKRPEVIYGHTAIVDSSRRVVRMRRLSAPAHLDWKSFKKGMLVCHQAFIVRRDKALPYDLAWHYSSDFDWCIRVMKDSSCLLNTGLILADYLEEGMTTRNRKASLEERFSIMSIHYGLFRTVLLHIFFLFRFVVKH